MMSQIRSSEQDWKAKHKPVYSQSEWGKTVNIKAVAFLFLVGVLWIKMPNYYNDSFYFPQPHC